MSDEIRTAADRDCRRLLEEPPAPPLDLDRFSSNTLFGESGIYPAGSPMRPADGAPLTEHAARRLLTELSGASPDGSAVARFDDDRIARRVPDPTVRAALCLLEGGPAAPVLDAFVHGDCEVHTLGVGATVGPGRVFGPEADAPVEAHRVLNERYAAEHPAVIAPSLAHALCHHGDRASNAEEATLHGLLAAVHAWLLARTPSLALLGTELSRRQSSLTITLLNARAPGSSSASIRQPDGPGAIPGGNPALQTPDLWSIPFTSRPTDECYLAVPDPVRHSLSRLAGEHAPEPPSSYDDELGSWCTEWLGEGDWFGPCERVAAARALALIA